MFGYVSLSGFFIRTDFRFFETMEEIVKDDLNGPATSTPEKLNGKFKLDLSEVSKNVVNLTPKGDHNSQDTKIKSTQILS